MEYHSLPVGVCLLLQLWRPPLALLYYIISSICFSALSVKDIEAVLYTTHTSLDHAYAETWAMDGATESDAEAPPPALTQTNCHINHIVVVFRSTIVGSYKRIRHAFSTNCKTTAWYHGLIVCIRKDEKYPSYYWMKIRTVLGNYG